MKFPFYDAPNTATITCCHILENGEPIFYVSHLTHSGIVKKIDEFERKLIMQDETVIPTEQISVIQGEMFKGLYE